MTTENMGCVFVIENEQKLATHIKQLNAAAFYPTLTEVRTPAYKLTYHYKL